MRFAFIHTADWQIGKRFGAFEAEKAAVLRDQRLGAVDRLAKAARAIRAENVLVAGDVFDSETVSDALAGRLLSRLQGYPDLVWHLLPGNHDPARAGGVWEAIVAGGLPANVRVYLTPEPAEIANGVVLLPAPLTSKSTSRDPTAWMDGANLSADSVRIGLAHGSVQGFGSDGDANVRAVWLFSRNDAVGNVAVVAAALLVAVMDSPWPDLLTAAVIAGLFLHSAVQIVRNARRELRSLGHA